MTAPDRTARDVALAALGDRAGNVTAHLNRLLTETALAGPEAALARELALGVVRRRGTLDAVLRAFQDRPRPPAALVRNVLRLGAYQLLFLDRVPDFAAVSEAVRQARSLAPGARGFVNAVLRAVARSASPRQAGRAPAAGDVVPVGAGGFRRLDRCVFADPGAEPAGYLAAAYSLPASLAGKWVADLGGLDGAIGPALHAASRPPLILRVNRLRATVPQVLARLRDEGVAAEPHANGLSVVARQSPELARLAVFGEGLVQPQDASATAVVAGAEVGAGARVLDLCAAPGTKTTHLAERMDNRGRIVAVDVTGAKLERVEANCRRMGIEIVQTVLAEQVGSLQAGSFDLVLVDAPCSNTGVLARRPEARWRIRSQDVGSLAQLQAGLLEAALRHLASGGRLVYATCSIEPEENENVVAGLFARHPELTELETKLFLPHRSQGDGGFYSLLHKGR